MRVFILAISTLGLFACDGSGKQASQNLSAQSGFGDASIESSSKSFQMKSSFNANAIEVGTQRSSNYVLTNGSI